MEYRRLRLKRRNKGRRGEKIVKKKTGQKQRGKGKISKRLSWG